MIVIPMAGLSRRFAEAGYQLPKYMLEAHGRTLFDQAVLSFAHYFADRRFLFVARSVAGTEAFIEQRCAALGLKRHRTIILDEPTRGQAETVALGVVQTPSETGFAPEDGLTIFNIDTFRPNYRFPVWTTHADGFLETFVGDGANWSFVRPAAAGTDRVAETSEKRRISDYCCTGLYHFARIDDFLAAFQADSARPAGEWDGGECYVAPLYNRLIASGRDIRFTVIPREMVVFCGVPDEYDAVQRGSPIYR